MSTTETPAADERNNTNTPVQDNRSSARRWLTRIVGVFAITLLLLYLALPFALKFGITHLLSEQSGRPVTMGQLMINPLTGKLFITQLQYVDNDPAQPDLYLGYASVQLDLAALIDKQIHIEEIVISNVDIGVRRDEATTIAGFTLPVDDSENGSDNSSGSDETQTLIPTEWRVALHAINIDDVRLNYVAPELSSRSTIERLNLGMIEPDNGSSVTPLKLALELDRGLIDFDGKLELFGEVPTVNGALTITQLEIAPYSAPFLPPHLKHVAGVLSFESRLNLTMPADGTPQISLIGDSTIEQFSLASKTHPQSYINSEQVAFNGIDLWLPEQIVLGELRLDGLDLNIARDVQGETGLTPPATADAATSAKTTVETEETMASDSPRIIVASTVIDGESHASFSDATVTPNFEIALKPLQIELGPIDNQQAEAPTPLKLSATIDESATLTVDGTITPFTDPFATDIHAKVEGLELPTLSPYTEAFIGYELRRGRFATDTKMVIADGQLDINNRLTLTKLSLRESDHKKARGLINELEMPLDSALDLLRDGDDNIVFDLPVKGRLDDPQFKLGGVMKLAVGKGMKMAAMNYLTNALQPLGTALLIKRVVGEITKPRFKPLLFAAGSAELDPTTQESLDKIGNLLSKRPQLSITVCGIAMQNDHMALSTEKEATEQQMHELATARATNTRDYLTGSQGINSKQLFECNPVVSPEPSKEENQTIAGVEISL